MVSDVPIGAFLSGGIDSSAVVAFMSRHSSQPVKTYSIGFQGSTGAQLYNELPYARQVAEQFGTDHHEIVVQPDVATLLPDLIWHMDEPIADAAFITTYLVSKFARQDVTVILSGVGGDELFGGYKRYLDEHYRSLYRRIPGPIRSGVIAPLAELLPSDRHSPRAEQDAAGQGVHAGGLVAVRGALPRLHAGVRRGRADGAAAEAASGRRSTTASPAALPMRRRTIRCAS